MVACDFAVQLTSPNTSVIPAFLQFKANTCLRMPPSYQSAASGIPSAYSRTAGVCFRCRKVRTFSCGYFCAWLSCRRFPPSPVSSQIRISYILRVSPQVSLRVSMPRSTGCALFIELIRSRIRRSIFIERYSISRSRPYSGLRHTALMLHRYSVIRDTG